MALHFPVMVNGQPIAHIHIVRALNGPDNINDYRVTFEDERGRLYAELVSKAIQAVEEKARERDQALKRLAESTTPNPDVLQALIKGES